MIPDVLRSFWWNALRAAPIVVFLTGCSKSPDDGNPYEYNIDEFPDDGNPYEYNIDEFRKDDSVRVLYEEMDPLVPAAETLEAFAVSGDDRLISSGKGRIFVQDTNGSLLREIRAGENARCLAAENSKRIYAGMEKTVNVFDGAGNRVASWASLGENALIVAIAVREDRVVLADAGNRMLWLYDRKGTLIRWIGRREQGDPESGFLLPSACFDVAFAEDGTIWAVDSGRLKLKNFSREGAFVGGWGEGSMEWKGFSGCCNPVRFCLLPNGGFVTVEKGMVRVKVYDSKGVFLGAVAGPGRFGEGDSGMLPSVDASGFLYIYAPRENRILRFVPLPAMETRS